MIFFSLFCWFCFFFSSIFFCASRTRACHLRGAGVCCLFNVNFHSFYFHALTEKLTPTPHIRITKILSQSKNFHFFFFCCSAEPKKKLWHVDENTIFSG